MAINLQLLQLSGFFEGWPVLQTCWFGFSGDPMVACCNPLYPPVNEFGEQQIWWQYRIHGYCCPANRSNRGAFRGQTWRGNLFSPPQTVFTSSTVLYPTGLTRPSTGMESSSDFYRIQSFDMDTQMLLKTALKGRQVLSSLLETQCHVSCCANKWNLKTYLFCVRSKFSESREGIKHHHWSVLKGPSVQQRGGAHLLHHCAGLFSLFCYCFISQVLSSFTYEHIVYAQPLLGAGWG